jgi:hypothetical protein
MEFGKVAPEELDSIKFTIPPDRPETTALLLKEKTVCYFHPPLQ